MSCPKCGADMEMMVDVTMLIPEEFESLLSKKAIRDKRVKLYAAGWEYAKHFCRNKNCGYIYGLERPITKLIKQQEEKIKELEATVLTYRNQIVERLMTYKEKPNE